MSVLTIPAPVDPHVHLRDLDWSHKATAESETAAALRGGYWAVLDMPNTPPATISPARLEAKSKAFDATARCDFGLFLGASSAGVDPDLTIAADRAMGLKLYCDPTTGDLLVDDDATRLAHLQAWQASSVRPVAVHAEGETLARVLGLVRRSGARIHACHVSSADEISMLRTAKRDGLPVSVGVTPHHLYLTHEDAARLGRYGLVRPQLRTRSDADALWRGIADGTVDVIESDHAPHAREEKASATPPPGFPGLETTLPLMALAVVERRITAERLIELVSLAPRRIFGLRMPPDTATRLDLDASYVIDEAELRTAPGWSPFAGMRVGGRVREVRIRGQVAFDGEEVLAAPGSGRDVAWS